MRKLFRAILIIVLTGVFFYLGLTFIFTPLSMEDEIALTAIRCVGVVWFGAAAWITYNLRRIIQEL
jgi:hypothetical protein